MSARRWWVMVPLIVGVFLSPLNVGFTAIALPSMRSAFDVDIKQVSWVGTAYFIPSIALMPLQGYLAERWSVRGVYISGLLLLTAGGFLAALAPSIAWLLLSRGFQGMGWSALPWPLPLSTRRFRRNSRVK
jgi:MFS transporter, DHA2 family, lincomycin resistance protein